MTGAEKVITVVREWVVRLGLRWAVWVLLVGMGCGSGEGPDNRGEGTARTGERETSAAAESVDQGRELFKRNGCAVCHGEEGRGDGRIAQTLTPRPRNFRDLAAYKQGASVEEIVQTLEKGVAGGSTMPAYPHLSEEERRSIAQFIAHLQEQP